MKIFLLHGDNTPAVASRLTKFIDEAKKRSWKIERIGGDAAFSLQESMSATSLFPEEKFYILEDIKKVSKKDIDWIKENAKGLLGNLVLVSNSVLPKTTINAFGKIDKIETFELPKRLWTFLDSFFPGNSKIALKLFHEVVSHEAVELVVALLARQLRDYFIALEDPTKLSYPEWRVKKIASTASKFGLPKVKNIISRLSEADYQAKIGKTNLIMELDLIIVEELE